MEAGQMNDKQTIRLQRWWMAQIRAITLKVMKDEQKRLDRIKRKNMAILGDLDIEKKSDIDDLYAYGVITDRKREKLLDLFEQAENPDELYQAKINLLQELYDDAHRVMLDLGQEV
jgi:hypothetical protein